jgi:hypothetical protein
MADQTSVPVPRGSDPPITFSHQGPAYSSRVNDWLVEDQRTMPWNNIDSVPTASHPDLQRTSAAGSIAAATQGSTARRRQ